MSVTIVIILITIGISIYAFNNDDVMYRLIFDTYSIKRNKSYYKFITSGFVHGNYMHLFFNMFALYSFGQITEYFFNAFYGPLGNIFYIIFYLVALVVSELPSYVQNKNNMNYSSLGASGAISAMVIIAIIYAPFEKFYFFFIPMPGLMMGILYIGYSYFMDSRQFDKVNHTAHLYGALFGIITTAFLFPELMIRFWDLVNSRI